MSDHRLNLYILPLLYISLVEVLYEESKLYLVFEFLDMDLKRYLDTLPKGKTIDRILMKVY